MTSEKAPDDTRPDDADPFDHAVAATGSLRAEAPKCDATRDMNSSWFLIAIQCSIPPALQVIADLPDARADLERLLDALDDVRGRADPDVVLLDQLLVRDLGELLHDPGRVEAVVRLQEPLGRGLLVLGQRRAVALDEPDGPVPRLTDRRVAVLVEMAGMDPHDVGRRPVLRAPLSVEVELLLERDVRQERRHGDAPSVLGRELVRAVGRSSESDLKLPRRERHDLRTRDVEVRPVVRELLLRERLEEQVDGFLVAWARMLVERNSRLLRNPAVAPSDAELVPALGEDVCHGDRGRQDRRVVVRERVQHRAKPDLLRALRGSGEERGRVGRDRELGKEEVLDRRVDVVAEPVGVDHLLEDFPVHLLRRLPRMELDLGVQPEPHARTSRDMSDRRVFHRPAEGSTARHSSAPCQRRSRALTSIAARHRVGLARLVRG